MVTSEEEWLSLEEAVAWIACRLGWTADEWHATYKAFRVKWHVDPTFGENPILDALRVEASGRELVEPRVAQFAPIVAALKGERNLDAAALADELQADLNHAASFAVRLVWAERQLVSGIGDGVIEARGKRVPNGWHVDEPPPGARVERIPANTIPAGAGLDLQDNRLFAAGAHPLDSVVRWSEPEWWEVRVRRADLEFYWPLPRPATERDVFAGNSWTLLETLAWIATREAEEVAAAERESEETFQEIRLPDGAAQVAITSGPGPSLSRLQIALAIRPSWGEHRVSKSMYEASDLLRTALGKGAIGAHGLANRRGDPREVPAQAWEYLEFADDHGQPCARLAKSWSGGTVWYELRFLMDQVLETFPSLDATASATRNTHWIGSGKAQALYKERLRVHRATHGRRPTEQDDLQWAKEHRVHRHVLRQLRRESVGDEGRKGGRPRRTPRRLSATREVPPKT